jgi:hypothetical protein
MNGRDKLKILAGPALRFLDTGIADMKGDGETS